MQGYNTTVHTTVQATANSQKQRKVSKAVQYLYRCIAPAQRNPQVTKAIQGLKVKQLLGWGLLTPTQAKRAKGLAFTGKAPRPTTNRFTPKFSPTGNVRAGYTALGYAMVGYSVITKNTQGRYVTTPLQAKAVVTAQNANSTLAGVIPQRNNTPAQLITITPPNSPFNTGYTLLYMLP